jgi:hypothetical protein
MSITERHHPLAARLHTLELQELRLVSPDTDGTVARLVAGSYRAHDHAVPLLTSIDERRDVAIVRAFNDADAPERAQDPRAMLGPLVAEWQSPKRYRLRIAERSQSPPTYYRLAVTESGINDTHSDSLAPRPTVPAGSPSQAGLLWIGSPIGTYAGLLILLGGRDDPPRQDASEWPLPMSRALGVRIYDNRA